MKLMTTNFCTQAATVITASSADTNFPVSNLKNPFRSKRWRSTGVTSENVVFDIVTTESIDSVVILWPKEDGILLSNTATITIQANATNTWGAPAVSQVLTVDNTYMLASYYFSTSQNYRYWRVLIQDTGNPNGYVGLGVVWLGKSLSIPNAQNGFSYSLADMSKITKTDFGHTYVDEYPQMITMQFAYKTMQYADVQTLENAFRVNGVSDPVMVVLDPTAIVFNKNHFAVYGKFQPAFSLTHVNYDILDSGGIVITELA